jgi:hypothetical protein
MQLLGAQHDVVKQCYYVDNHEREDIVGSRIVYCRSLTALEQRLARWVVVTPEIHAELKGCVAEEYRANFPAGSRQPDGSLLMHCDDARTSESFHAARTRPAPAAA